MTANKRVWKVPAAPYQSPPDTPYEYARVHEVNRVVAWVQLDTIPAEIMPLQMFSVRPP